MHHTQKEMDPKLHYHPPPSRLVNRKASSQSVYKTNPMLIFLLNPEYPSQFELPPT